jgi:hypothetical protein
MSNDKKPKKAKPAVIHGATHKDAGLSGTLAEAAKPYPQWPAKKKK